MNLYCSSDNEYLLKQREVREYHEDVNRILFKHRYAPAANFTSQNQKIFQSLGRYGNGSLFIDQLYGAKGLRYRSAHIGQIYWEENHQGTIDKELREFTLTIRQAVQQFGTENLPEKMKSKIGKDENAEFKFVHYVSTRVKDYDPERLDAKGMPIASYYVAVDEKWVIREEGYNTFPYANSRYDQAEDETYGRGPAMSVLGAIKSLNEQKRIMLQQGHRALNPVFLTHDDGVIVDFTPGATNSGGISADGRTMIGTLPVGNFNIGKDMMDMERSHINDAFLVTLFQILMDSPQMTATEVLERTKEKGILMAPTMGRQQTEYLGPMIIREIDVLAQQGLLPKKPQALLEAEEDYSIGYRSPLNRAQQAEEATGFMRAVEIALNVANTTGDQSVLYAFNFKKAIPEMAEIQGSPVRWMNDPKVVAQMNQALADQKQQEMEVQAAPAAAAMMKTAQGAK